MTEPADHRDRRVYVWWGVLMCALALVAAFCFLVLMPCIEIRREVANWGERDSIASKVKKLGGPEVAARKLRVYISLPARFAPGRHDAIRLLGGCGPAGTPTLIRLVEGQSDEQVRNVAAAAMLLTEDPRIVEFCARMIRSDSGERRSLAALGLGHSRDRSYTPVLVSALVDPEGIVRARAASALGEMGDPAAVPSLIKALGDPDKSVRFFAIKALDALEDPRAIEPLAAMLQDEEVHNRVAAIKLLGRMKDSRSVGPLIAELDHRDSWTRGPAARALAGFDDPRILAALEAMRAKELDHWAAGQADEAIKTLRRQSPAGPETGQ